MCCDVLSTFWNEIIYTATAQNDSTRGPATASGPVRRLSSCSPKLSRQRAWRGALSSVIVKICKPLGLICFSKSFMVELLESGGLYFLRWLFWYLELVKVSQPLVVA